MVISKKILKTILKDEYPFKENSFQLSSGHRLNFINQGKGDPIVMVHGNPTWSFYYRNLAKEFSKNFQVIVPDHLGCGLSQKPQDYNYTLKNHINNLEELISHLNLKNIILIVHDWGGAIGSGYAIRHPENIKKMVVFNSAAFLSKHIPTSINFCKIPIFRNIVIRKLNGFAWPATFMAVNKPMKKKIKQSYLFPYQNYKDRVAISNFVKDIPMNKNHQSYSDLKEIEDKLKTIHCPKLIIWGAKDFCFNDHFYKRWLDYFPKSETMYIKDAGHYVLEDSIDKIIPRLDTFLNTSKMK